MERCVTVEEGAPTYNFAIFSQKLHEIERIWVPGGGREGRLRSATGGSGIVLSGKVILASMEIKPFVNFCCLVLIVLFYAF